MAPIAQWAQTVGAQSSLARQAYSSRSVGWHVRTDSETLLTRTRPTDLRHILERKLGDLGDLKQLHLANDLVPKYRYDPVASDAPTRQRVSMGAFSTIA